ncbi:MAG: exodeoxyribonuclease I [Pseudomonadota bacterium]
MKKSFYWHDYETFGIDPGKDRAAQFAGLRTDEDLNVIGKPLVIYCQPANDFLPQPEACLITGITPQLALQKGLPEYQFFKKIITELSTPNTCTVGYNNIRFDDEFTRFGLYRNFYDAYAREWQNGNSRWDLIDMLRLTAALRPDGINWPINEKNQISFRLEKLTEANGISHQDAHDALADVQATIAIAKLVKTQQPRLYDYCLQLRNKHKVLELLDIYNPKPLLHISGMYSGTFGHCAMVLPLMVHPENKNGIIVYDLRYEADDLLTLSADEIKQRLYTPRLELEKQGLQRIALKTIHINKCPALAPLNTLSSEAAERLDINIKQQKINCENLIHNHDLIKKLNDVYQSNFDNSEVNNKANTNDVDKALYSGGFFSPADKDKMELITQADEKTIMQLNYHFKDSRLDDLFFRYKCRNFEHLLSSEEKQLWEKYRLKRMTDPNENASIHYADYTNKLNQLLLSENDPLKLNIIHKLKEYSHQIGLL